MNPKSENWVQDLNDSIVESKDSDAPAEVPTEPSKPKKETKKESFKKKHHFRKEKPSKKKAEESEEHSAKA